MIRFIVNGVLHLVKRTFELARDVVLLVLLSLGVTKLAAALA